MCSTRQHMQRHFVHQSLGHALFPGCHTAGRSSESDKVTIVGTIRHAPCRHCRLSTRPCLHRQATYSPKLSFPGINTNAEQDSAEQPLSSNAPTTLCRNSMSPRPPTTTGLGITEAHSGQGPGRSSAATWLPNIVRKKKASWLPPGAVKSPRLLKYHRDWIPLALNPHKLDPKPQERIITVAALDSLYRP